MTMEQSSPCPTRRIVTAARNLLHRERFQTPIRLVLVVDDGQGGSSPNGAVPPPVSPSPPSDAAREFDEEDPEEFEAAPAVEDHQAEAVDRLLQAFPGASEIVE
jgi:recombination protein RecR